MDSPPFRPAPLHGEPSALPEGTVLSSRFTLQAFVGRGGMGAIYRARDKLVEQAASNALFLEELARQHLGAKKGT